MSIPGMGFLYFVIIILIVTPSCSRSHDISIDNNAINFVDVSELTGIAKKNDERLSPFGIVDGDFDGNGWTDLIFLNHGRSPSIFKNLQGVKFEQHFPNRKDGIFELPKINYSERGDRHGAGCGDFDNDGLPDLLITSGAMRGETLGIKQDELHENLGAFNFKNITIEAGVSNTHGRGRRAQWADFNRDGHLDLLINNFDSPNVLYIAIGNGTFNDASWLLPTNNGHIWAIWIDYNSDGWPDLFSPERPRLLLKNQGDNTFLDVTSKVGLNRLKGWYVANAWADIDNDGHMDAFMGHWWPGKSQMVYLQAERIKRTYQLPGFFYRDENMVAASFGDLDNDGYQDLVILTTKGLYVYHNESGRNLRRIKNLDITMTPGKDSDLRLVDYDRDGGLDIVIFGEDNRYLLRNTSHRGNWLEITFRGSNSNSMGIGTLIQAELENGMRIIRQNYGSLSNSRSAGCGPIHLGLGYTESVDLKIMWPSGSPDALKVPANQKMRIEETQ
jgi:hypothetical protein